ncbi:uncharacterized protein LOC133377301 [Rhineura floridana]|uniref:uncharacterized protein LOC133377301 n=1 Tax=Rhineura floridana TaxID=261503 RepID=UPI002AC81616|nr:uncharacterized protein LOC133377301 [Rhineura floridana]
MAPPARRNKKAVDYSQFGSADDDNDDDDFADAAIPSSKKSKRVCSGSMKEKTVQQKKPSKEEIQLQKATPNKRVALDHRLYQRDLEVALALSVNKSPGSNHKVQDSRDVRHCRCCHLLLFGWISQAFQKLKREALSMASECGLANRSPEAKVRDAAELPIRLTHASARSSFKKAKEMGREGSTLARLQALDYRLEVDSKASSKPTPNPITV